MPDRVVALFTKPAEPGRVKTRLIGELSAEEAAALHATFVEDLVARLRGGEFELRVAWALDGAGEAPDVGLPALHQEGQDLGERLFCALGQMADEGASVAAIGSDHPELTSKELETAFELLESGDADVVLGPALDGGYYLVALSPAAILPTLFESIPWSTDRVLAETLARCRASGLAVSLLAEASDVDTPADLARLTAALASGAVEAPRTARLLRSWGRLSTSRTEMSADGGAE